MTLLWLTHRACLRRSVRERRMREIRTSGVTREGVAGLTACPLYSTGAISFSGPG